MPGQGSAPATWCFGVFTYGSDGELRKGGTVLRLQEQPRRILEALLEHPGEVVTRQQLQEQLWPSGVNVDFDVSLNAAVRRLRQALMDNADRPRYIETLPRRGYRFIAPVQRVEPAVLSAIETGAAPPEAPPAPPSRRLQTWIFAAAGLALTVAGAALFWTVRTVPAPRAQHASILVPPGLNVAGANGRTVAISDDGQTIAYSAAGTGGRYLYIRPLGRSGTNSVPGSEGAVTPVFVRGETLAWTTERGLYEEAGGRARALATWPAGSPGSSVIKTARGDLAFSQMGGTRSTGPAAVAVSTWILPRGASAPERLPTVSSGPGMDVQFPQQVIDDRYFLFSSNRGPLERAVLLLDRQTRQQKVLAKPAMGGRVLPNGRFLYFWNGELLEAPFDYSTQTVTAAGIPVLSGVAAAGWTGGNADLSANGTLVYVPASPRPDVRLVWVDVQGGTSPVPVPAGPLRVADLSADGKHLLMIRETGPESSKLLDYDLATGSTHDLATDVDPRACWSGDGKRVVYSRMEPGDSLPTIHLLDTVSHRSDRWLPFQGTGQFGVQWAVSAGRMVFLTGFHPTTQIDIWWAETRDRARTSAPLIVGPGIQTHPRISPDGRWIAYTDGFPEGSIAVRAVDRDAGPVIRVPGDGGAPLWSGDGRTIYYRSEARFLAVSFTPGPPPRVGVPRVLFEGNYAPPTHWSANTFFHQATGRFLVGVPAAEAKAPSHIEVITNWLQEIGSR